MSVTQRQDRSHAAWTTFVLTALMALLSLAPTPARGAGPAPAAEGDADRARAEALVAEGLEHARARRFEQAAALFDDALKLYPHPEIAHNLGRAREELGDLAAAIASFRAALEMDASYVYAGDARKRVSALDRKLRKTHGLLQIRSVPTGARVTLEAKGSGGQTALVTPLEYWMPAGRVIVRGAKSGFQDARQELDVKAGQELPVEVVLMPVAAKGFVTVTANVNGARVALNGDRIGATPLRGHLVAAGSYSLRVEADGYEAWEESVVVAADKENPVNVALVRLAAAAAAPATRPPSDQPAAGPTLLTEDDGGGVGGLTIGGGILVGVGAAAAAGGAVLTWLAYERQKDAEAVPNDGVRENDDEFSRLSNKAKTFDKAGAAVLSVAAGALVAGVVMLVLPSGDDDEQAAAAAWAPYAVPSRDGLGVGAAVTF